MLCLFFDNYGHGCLGIYFYYILLHYLYTKLLLANNAIYINFLFKAIIFLCKVSIFTKSKDIETIHTKIFLLE